MLVMLGGGKPDGDNEIQTRTRGEPRTRLQSEQRQVYRDKLLRAAERVFGRKSYSEANVHDITRQARVGRATFYRHFGNKLEIFAAVTDRLVARVQPSDEIFTRARVIDTGVFAAWVGENVALYRDNMSIIRTIRQAASIEPVFFRDHSTAHHDRIVERLGDIFPAFHRASSHAPADHAVRMEAHFLIRQLQVFCYDVAVTDWAVGLDAGTRLLARQFMRFVDEHGAPR